jgi:hypothetical protein
MDHATPASTASWVLSHDLALIPVGSPTIIPTPVPLSWAANPSEDIPSKAIIRDFFISVLELSFIGTKVVKILFSQPDPTCSPVREVSQYCKYYENDAPPSCMRS